MDHCSSAGDLPQTVVTPFTTPIPVQVSAAGNDESDLAEPGTDIALQNSGHITQIMDHCPSAGDLPQTVVTPFTTPIPAQVSAAGNSNGYNISMQSSSAGGSTNGQHTNDTQQQQHQQQIQQQPNGSHSSTYGDSGEETWYVELGIITTRPMRREYSDHANRLHSFNGWPTGHHMKREDLSSAGFFFTGSDDCVRCFYCGGGLRNWEAQEDARVEHARWFPRCGFLRLKEGKDFIDEVQMMIKEADQDQIISYGDVIERMSCLNSEEEIKRDPAVLSVIDEGFDGEKIYQLAIEIRKKGEILSSVELYKLAVARWYPKKESGNNLGSDSVSGKGRNENRDKEIADTIPTKDNEFRQQTSCKICNVNKVAVVCLPCGHIVSCTECSSALTKCPLCQVGIKGIVQAYFR